MIMKKFLTLFIVAVIIATALLGLPACKDPFNDDEFGRDKVAGKVTIRVAVLNEFGEKNLMTKFKSEFEKLNNYINIKIEAFPGDYYGSMDSYIAKPSLIPDIIWTPGDQHSRYSSAGHFVDLTQYYAASPETALDNYYESAIDTTHFTEKDEGIWFAPRDYNKPVVFLNREMFAAAQIPIPAQSEWNMAKFLDICEAFKDKMNNPNNTLDERRAGLVASSCPVQGDLEWLPVSHSFIEHYGGLLIDPDKKDAASLVFDSAANIEAYKCFYRDLIWPGYSKESANFLGKGAAMWFQVRPRLQAIVNAGIDVDFLPMPTDKIGAGCSGYAISAEAKKRLDTTSIPGGNTKNNAELAWEFIKWIITEQGQEIFGATGSGVPVLKSLEKTGAWLEYKSASLNHAAFTAKQDCDINLNKVRIYQPQNQAMIFNEIGSLILTVMKSNTWDGSPYGATPVSPGNFNKLSTEVAAHKNKIIDRTTTV